MAQCKCGAINEYTDEAEYGKDGYVCYDCRGVSPVPHTQVAGPSMLPNLDASWAPDLVAIAAKEREILDLVSSDRLSPYDRDTINDLNRLRDELLTLRTNPADVEELEELVRQSCELRAEITKRADRMPRAIRNKVYGV